MYPDLMNKCLKFESFIWNIEPDIHVQKMFVNIFFVFPDYYFSKSPMHSHNDVYHQIAHILTFPFHIQCIYYTGNSTRVIESVEVHLGTLTGTLYLSLTSMVCLCFWQSCPPEARRVSRTALICTAIHDSYDRDHSHDKLAPP